MAFIIRDRVKESTTSTGTGAITLGGAAATFDTFQSYMTNGDTTYYAIVHTTSGTDEWEVGLGTWNTGNTLTRTTVLAGSNGTSAQTFSAGAKDVFMTLPSARAAFANDDVTFANVSVTGTVDGRDIAADGTKLDTVETNADVTDSANVTSSGALMRSGGTMTGSLILNADPTDALGAATKQYVDTLAASGVHYHDPVRVSIATNLPSTYDNGSSGVGATLTNSSTQAAIVIDGVSLVLNDRVLIKGQTNARHNGVYKVTTVGNGSTNWVITRTTDTDSYGASDKDALGEGDAFFVSSGAVNGGALDVMNVSGAITFGTTEITFVHMLDTTIYSAGTGLTLTGTEFAAAQDISTTANPQFGTVTANITGNVSGTSGSTTGNAATATALATARTVQLSGDVTGSASFDGSANINITASVQDDSHAHVISNVDGLQTALDARVPTSRTLTAGNGLTGGGDLSANRTFTVGGGTGITVNANDIAIDSSYTGFDSRYVNVSGDTMTGNLTLTPSGFASGTQTLGVINISSAGSGETRAIDIDGAWSSGESKSISFIHGSSSSNFVGQINMLHNGTGSSLRFGKLYHGADSTAYPMTLTSTSTTTADLNINGGVTIDSGNGDQLLLDNAGERFTQISFSNNGSQEAAIWYDATDNYLVAHANAGDGFKVQTGGTNDRLTIDASGNVTINGGTAWHSNNDGSGSGLDADLLDGYQLSTTRDAAATVPVRDGSGYLQLGWINTTSGPTTSTITKIYGTYNNDNYIRYFTPATLISQQGIWTSSNDGSGSGLDADTVDGIQASDFIRYSTNMTGTLKLDDQKIQFASGSGSGSTFATSHYSMGVDIANGGWSNTNYSDLIIGYHTGIRIGAGYSGIRFYDNSPTTDTNNTGNGNGGEELLMTIGGGGSTTSGAHVTVHNNLTVQDDINVGNRSNFGSDTATADEQNNVSMFASSPSSNVAQAGAFHNKLRILGGSGQSRDLQLYQRDSEYAHISSSWTGNRLVIDSNLSQVNFNQAITTTSTIDGRDVATDGTKLDTIATNANNYSLPATPSVTSLNVASGITHTDDTNTNINFAPDQITMTVGGSTELYVNTTGVRLGDSGNGYFQPVSGNYGSIQIDGGAHSGWEGYSIGGRMVFMHDNANVCGIFNDVDNEWLFYGVRNGGTRMYYNCSNSFETTSGGAQVNGSLAVTGTVDGRDVAADGTKLDGIAAGATNTAPGLPLSGGTLTGDLTIPSKLIHSGDTDTYMQFNTNEIRFRTGGVDSLIVNTTQITSQEPIAAPYFEATSDINLKTNIKKIVSPLEMISNLNGYTFNWKESGKASAGIIAQEVEKVLPSAVSENEGGSKSVNYNELIGVLVEAVKEQQIQIDSLKSMIGKD